MLWTLEAVALRETRVHEHTAQVSAASVRVYRAGEGARAGFPTVAHHVFVWEGPGSGRQRAERRHSWCIKGSLATTFVDYTICESNRGYGWKVFVMVGSVQEKKRLKKTRATLMDNWWHFFSSSLRLFSSQYLLRAAPWPLASNSSTGPEHNNIWKSIVPAARWADRRQQARLLTGRIRALHPDSLLYQQQHPWGRHSHDSARPPLGDNSASTAELVTVQKPGSNSSSARWYF